MSRPPAIALTGVRGRVVLVVLAVSACLYSLVGTFGFVQLAGRGRADIRQRINEVLDDLDAAVRSGNGTVTISTADGVRAFAEAPSAARVATPSGEIVVERTVRVGTTTVRLTGRASQVRLAESLRTLHRWLWLGVPFAAVLTGAMAGLVTGRALRPVSRITDLAGSIGPHDEATRVPVPDTGDEIERLARTVNEMLDRIASGRRAQRQFTSDAAHELRTPLMALQGELELAARQGGGADGDLTDRLQRIVHRLAERIDALVVLSTLDEGRPLHLQPVSLDEVVREEARLLARPTEIISAQMVSVTADGALVSRAVSNLLTNAHRAARSQVRVTVEAGDTDATVHVDDDGHGIEEHELERALARFGRLDDARHTDGGGAGLGLSIVARVAAAHGGGLVASRSPLGGARMSLRLPLRERGDAVVLAARAR